MNKCLCESCCDKDWCLFYQDYKNPDGIISEPITACGRYKKLHTVEDTYTKEEVISMLTDIQLEIEKQALNLCDEIYIAGYDRIDIVCIDDVKKIIQEKINILGKEKNDYDR